MTHDDQFYSGPIMSTNESCISQIRWVVSGKKRHLEQLYQIVTTHAPHGYAKIIQEWRRVPEVEAT